MISNFPVNPMANVGGAAAFLFSPAAFIASLPQITNKAISSAPIFIGSATFYQGYATLETLKFTESSKNDNNGTSYNWVISGFIPGDSAALVGLIEEMESYERHIVVVKDMMGINRLVGYNAPLLFTADYTPGNDTKSARGYNFTFTGSGTSRAPVYNA